MTSSEFIIAYRKFSNTETLTELDERISFKPATNENNHVTDLNLIFRTEVVQQLLNDFSLTDIKFIRKLFKEELACEDAIQIHDNLYQLCFYLFSLKQLEDTFILYEAKFEAKNMDVGCMLDRTSIVVGHEIDEVINYVESEFGKNPGLKQRYPKILQQLKSLQEDPDYDSIEHYHSFIKGYFLGHETIAVDKSNPSPAYITIKPWWKFW